MCYADQSEAACSPKPLLPASLRFSRNPIGGEQSSLYTIKGDVPFAERGPQSGKTASS